MDLSSVSCFLFVRLSRHHVLAFILAQYSQGFAPKFFVLTSLTFLTFDKLIISNFLLVVKGFLHFCERFYFTSSSYALERDCFLLPLTIIIISKILV